TPAVHAKIATLLEGLRKQQDVAVAVEVRIITTSNDFLERIGVDFETKDKPPFLSKSGTPADAVKQIGGDFVTMPSLTYLNEKQVFQFLETIQGEQRTNVLQAPKITAFNGQAVTIACAEHQFFVTNVNPVKLDGQTAMVPQNEALATGFYFSLQSAVSADGKFVNLNLKANLTSLASAVVPLFPVVTPIFPVVEGGFQGPPVNFTQFVQQPKFNTLALDRTLKIPDG